MNSSELESSWIILGNFFQDCFFGVLLYQGVGTATQVSVDPHWTLKRDEEHHDVVGFMHTHPHWTADPSSQDDRTMDAWVTCLGKPLISVIKGTDGVWAYVYWTGSDGNVSSDGRYPVTLFENPLNPLETLVSVNVDPERFDAPVRKLSLS